MIAKNYCHTSSWMQAWVEAAAYEIAVSRGDESVGPIPRRQSTKVETICYGVSLYTVEYLFGDRNSYFAWFTVYVWTYQASDRATEKIVRLSYRVGNSRPGNEEKLLPWAELFSLCGRAGCGWTEMLLEESTVQGRVVVYAKDSASGEKGPSIANRPSGEEDGDGEKLVSQYSYWDFGSYLLAQKAAVAVLELAKANAGAARAKADYDRIQAGRRKK